MNTLKQFASRISIMVLAVALHRPFCPKTKRKNIEEIELAPAAALEQ